MVKFLKKLNIRQTYFIDPLTLEYNCMSATRFYNTRVMMTRQCSFAHISVFNAPKLLFYFVIDMPDIEEIKNMHQNIMEL